MTTSLTAAHFDYEDLSPDVRTQVQQTTQQLRPLVQRSVDDIITIGQGLLHVKQLLPHGQFGPWLEKEFSWSERQAQNFMQVAERFTGKTANFARLDPSAAYLLAAPSTPDTVIDGVLSGEIAPTRQDIRAAIAELRHADADADGPGAWSSPTAGERRAAVSRRFLQFLDDLWETRGLRARFNTDRGRQEMAEALARAAREVYGADAPEKLRDLADWLTAAQRQVREPAQR